MTDNTPMGAMPAEKAKFNWMKLVVNSVLAGVCIAFAAMLYLYASVKSADDVLGRLACSTLFGFGLYFIIVMEYKLFTGMVAGLADMKPADWFQLVVCYVFNTLGILLVCALTKLVDNSIMNAIVVKGGAVAASKLANPLGGAFVSAIFCGVMITLAVKSNQVARAKGLNGTLGIIFPVILFIYLGLEHCIANQAYIFFAVLGGVELDFLQVFLFALVTALGNVVGGVAFPVLGKLANAFDGKKQ